MNPIFENRFYSNDKMMNEYVMKILCRRLFIGASFLAALSLVFLIVTLIDKESLYIGLFGTTFAIAVGTGFLAPFMTKRQLVNHEKNLHNGQKFETVVSFSDKVYISEGSVSATIEYEQLLEFKELKNSWALRFGKQNAIMLEPGSFTVGNADDFKVFIKSKIEN